MHLKTTLSTSSFVLHSHSSYCIAFIAFVPGWLCTKPDPSRSIFIGLGSDFIFRHVSHLYALHLVMWMPQSRILVLGCQLIAYGLATRIVMGLWLRCTGQFIPLLSVTTTFSACLLLRYAYAAHSYALARKSHIDTQELPHYPTLIPYFGPAIGFAWDIHSFWRKIT